MDSISESHIIPKYLSIEYTKVNGFQPQTRMCWYCDKKCDTFISICNNCKIERNKNKITYKRSFHIKSL